MSNVHDILEICLQEIEKGADIDSVLFRYPTYASELRPLLETAARAIKAGAPDPSELVVHRNRAKLLQHAALLRESKVQTATRRLWSVPLRRFLVTLIVVGVLFIGSTELVRAATMTLPGDNLYPVKRTWEDVRVLFTFNMQAREALEVEHENERLHELRELFTQGRAVQVDFSGLVTRQNGDLWLVAGVPVATSAQTDLPTQAIAIGDAIRVIGVTQPDGAVLAQRIELLPNGMPLPDIEDDVFEQDHSGEDNSGEGSGEIEAPTPDSNSGSGSESRSDEQSFHGQVESINASILVVNGQILNVSSAEVSGDPRVGSSAKVEGYYDANGIFIVTRIEFAQSESDGGSDSGSNHNENDGSNEEDHSEEDDSHNDNEYHEEADHSSDNSGEVEADH